MTQRPRIEAALVGPIMQVGEMADLVADAITIDNPGAEVHVRDHGSYVRIHTAGHCRLTRQTLSELAGHCASVTSSRTWLSSPATSTPPPTTSCGTASRDPHRPIVRKD